ncbi:MAG TPA: site-specific integrase [Candidatus Rubrimentiphilum sp.]|nr:site-specific integrase [Candidatus Rubrimentiphilum sp.]
MASKLRNVHARYNRKITDLRLGDYLEQWMRDGKSGWDPQTFRTYNAWLANHVVPYLGERKVSKITPAEVRAWLRRLEDEGVGGPTRKRALSTLRSALKGLVKEEQLDRNPCDAVDPPRIKSKPICIPQPAEVLKLLKAAPLWLRALLLIAFSCTMRQGEIFALHWTQIDLEQGSILVDKSLSVGWDGKPIRKTPKTKKSLRTVFLPSITTRILHELKRHQESTGYAGPWVFPNADGGPLLKSNFLRRVWKPLFGACDIQYFKFHATRHTGNSILIKENEDPLSISQRMGQADTRMTFDLYGHLFEGAARRTAKSMERGLESLGITEQAFTEPGNGRVEP